MSLTFSQSQGNGSTLSYTIVAEGGYFEDGDIVVELIAVDGGAITEQTLGTHYSIEDGNVIFVTAPTSDYYVRIRRSVSNDDTYSDFTRGNAFGADNLNKSFLFALYQMQQLADGFLPDDHYLKADLNAGNQKITNVADGEASGDAVNYGQVEELIAAVDETSEYADAAAASASEAAASAASAAASNSGATSAANIAVTAKNTALTYSTNSATSATSSATSATNSSTYASNASTSASNAATSASSAANSATSAASSSTAASGWATNSATSAISSAASASSASTSASDASTSATSAATSATSAATSAVAAAASAASIGLRPSDYGAAGDGSTDDTTALQACIDAADTAGVPVILDKLYKITDQLDIPDGISIIGHHRDTCGFKIFRADFNLSANGVLDLTVTDKYAARLENFQITTDMDTTGTVRANLTVFPPLIRAVGAPRFFFKNLRLNRAYIGIDATGNSGGCHISDCEIGAYNTGLKLDSALDFVFIDNVEFWPFGIADTASEAIYADGETIAIDAVDVDGLSFGNISTFWCKTNLDGCFGTIGTLNLDGNYSQLNIKATSRKSEVSIGALYKTTAAANDYCISVTGTYATNLSIGSAWMKNTVNLTNSTTQYSLIYLNQANSDLVIGNLRADIIGSYTRLISVPAGHLLLSNAYVNVLSTQSRSYSLIYATSSEISINNLKVATSSTSPTLIQVTSNYRHSFSNIVAPGWTVTIPSTNTLIKFNNVDTSTILSSTRHIHEVKKYKLTSTFNSSGTATFSTLPVSDYTLYTGITGFVDYGTTYKLSIDGSDIAIGNSAITVTTGVTSYSGLSCILYVDVIVD